MKLEQTKANHKNEGKARMVIIMRIIQLNKTKRNKAERNNAKQNKKTQGQKTKRNARRTTTDETKNGT